MSIARALVPFMAAVLLLSMAVPGLVLASDDLEPVSTAPDVVITISGSGVAPRTVTVSAGDVVELRNADGERHRMRSRSGPAEFDSGNLESGESVRYRFSASGTYAYIDEGDDDASGYHGRIVVEAAGGGGSTGSGGSAGGGGGGGASAATATVSIGDDFFSPASVRIAAGGTVTFRNEGDDEHSATSSGGRPIDSGSMGAGDTYRATFPTAGTFAFLCIFHSDMQGTVTVTAADGGTAPTPAPTPPAPSPTPAPTASAATGAQAPNAVAVDAADLEFRAPSVQVAAGGTVTWTNVGAAPHTVTADDASFDSGILATGATFAQTFAEPGTFAYLCALHPGMAGTVEVVAVAAAGAVAPVASPPPSTKPAAAAIDPMPTSAPALTSATVTGEQRLDPAEWLGLITALVAVSVAVIMFAKVLGGTVKSA